MAISTFRYDRPRREHHLYPYRGYGSHEEINLMGRVFRQKFSDTAGEGSLLVEIAKRLFRRGVANAAVEARFYGATQRVVTDRFGYFDVEMAPGSSPPSDRLWHEVELQLADPPRLRATGDIFIPPASARYVVISDIDDTVIFTGVANKIRMVWRLFFESAQSRVAFPGVAAFYRALHRGISGAELNPILYVSRGPWGIYEMLDAFFRRHNIPIGPILFLREWGMTLRRPFPRQARTHKTELVREMLALYDHLPFILIGDSGQRDPEIYVDIVREHPGRVLAIYIRNVSRKPTRREAIEELAEKVAGEGSSLVLASDTFAMARHAAEHEFISPDALGQVLGERIEEEGEAHVHPVKEVSEPTRGATQRAVGEGKVEEALEKETGEKSPPNVVVEPANQKSSERRSIRKSDS